MEAKNETAASAARRLRHRAGAQCISGLPPAMRADYRRGIDLTLRPGGGLIGVWFTGLDPELEGPPYPFSAAELTALFAEGYEIVDDYAGSGIRTARGAGACARAAPRSVTS